MASRFTYPCGCAECGDIDYPCEEHRTKTILKPVYPKKGDLVEEIIVTDPKTGGQKGNKLARFDLIPPDAMEAVACVYGEGAKKYAERNWEKGYSWGLSIAALERHLNKFKQRKDWDLEEPNPTGCHHMAQVAWHALALLTYSLRGLGTDDRTIIKNVEENNGKT